MPADVSEIVSGGARGVDQCARAYALAHGIKLTEYLPDYARHGLYGQALSGHGRALPRVYAP